MFFSFGVMDCSYTVNIQIHYVKPRRRRKEKYGATNLNEGRLILKAAQLIYMGKKNQIFIRFYMTTN